MIQDISHFIQVFSVQTDYGVDCKEGLLFDDLQSRAEMFESEEFPGEKETDVLAFADPRTSFIGARVMCGNGSFEIEDPSIKYYKNGDHQEYDLIRYVNAVVEGSSECGGHFPLHLNFNQLNGVSTTKGCYIGQELIQRTTHVGPIRKQTLPFMVVTKTTEDNKLEIDLNNFNALAMVDRGFSHKMQDLEIKDHKGMKVGKIIGS